MGEMEESTLQPGFDEAPVVTENALVHEEAALDAIAADLEVADSGPSAVPVAPVSADGAVTASDGNSDELAALAASLEVEDAHEDASAPATEAEPTAAAEPAAVEAPEQSEAAAAADETTAAFDAIPTAEKPVPEPVVAVSLPPSVPWWPFLAYLGAWVVLAGIAVWQLMQLPQAQVAYESSAYALMILGGLVMTAVGPVLILAVWLTVRAGRPAGNRAGLLTSSLLKGALVTLSGAIIWWAALVIVDILRLGTPL